MCYALPMPVQLLTPLPFVTALAKYLMAHS